jgi:hypothetical protein
MSFLGISNNTQPFTGLRIKHYSATRTQNLLQNKESQQLQTWFLDLTSSTCRRKWIETLIVRLQLCGIWRKSHLDLPNSIKIWKTTKLCHQVLVSYEMDIIHRYDLLSLILAKHRTFLDETPTFKHRQTASLHHYFVLSMFLSSFKHKKYRKLPLRHWGPPLHLNTKNWHKAKTKTS